MNTLDYQHIFHEIKNSVTLINSSLQLLEGQLPALNKENHWNNLVNEVNYLKNIILEISQTGNTEHLNLELININASIQQVSSFLRDAYPDIFWDFRLDPFLEDIPADPVKLQQILINLLKNSIEAMNGHGTVCLSSSATDTDMVISITDCGGGIAPDFEPEIYKLFTTSKPNGTGLGLAITQQLVNLHNGKLLLENHPGAGCTFSILLPRTIKN